MSAIRPPPSSESPADCTPAEFYRPGTGPDPSRLEPPEYPGHFALRRVDADGCIRWRGRFLFIGTALRGDSLGLKKIDGDLWSICLMHDLLARLDGRVMQLIDVPV